MKRKSSQQKRSSHNQSQNFSQLQISQFSQQNTNDGNNKSYANQKRKQKKKSYVSKSNDRFQAQDQQVVDIKVGDEFVRQHIRPNFLKKWDGQSNILELTLQQLQVLSPMMKAYWQIKSRYMNCIVFVQFGKFQFFAFEDDAIKLHQIFKKPLKKFSSFLMVNFWNKEIEIAKIDLFQRKIPTLVLNEVQDPEYKQMYGIFKRQISEIITPSIFFNYQSIQFRERIMVVIYHTKSKCGIVCIDIENNHFYLEQFDQKQSQTTNLDQIRRIINKYRPAQIVLQRKDTQIKKIAKQICQPFIIQISPLQISLLSNLTKMNELCQDQIFKRLILMYKQQYRQKNQDEMNFSFQPIVKALSMALHYMINFKLEAKIFGQGIFTFQDVQKAKLKPMFDAQVYQNLQVFSLRDEQNSFGKVGTLYHYLNKCSTTAGQKLLKRWIDNPLRVEKQIIERQKAITELISFDKEIQLQEALTKFGKLQKKVGDIYHWAISQKQEGKQYSRKISISIKIMIKPRIQLLFAQDKYIKFSIC